ncbi:TIR domain-containing protein [Plesiomonas shigelloides]|uniref:TIR domain-containing protein n=1 Tax=Plesiomonas shigelloides TaxID=703 RepID=UPI000A0FA81C|nr:TIR domain-containing protein [Plesiomonas shigelloides]
MKAFLSHSSIDKEIVREVANQLGRLNCIFDERSFDSGNEFQKSIEEKLALSTVFVFFATRNSLKSHWCNFELDQAFYSKLKGALKRSIVFILNDEIEVGELPSWLTSALIKKVNSPSAIARDIKHKLEEAAEEFQRPVFLGRSRERELLEEALNPIDGSNPPKTIAVFGLPGIGRRSLVKNIAKDLFSLHKCVEIEVEDGESLNSLCAKLADIIEPYSCQEELRDIINEINKLSETDALSRVVKNIKSIMSANELPIFVDSGGLTIENGCLSGFINKIIESIEHIQDAYICLVLSRRISHDNEVAVESVPVEQLSARASSQLISKLSLRASIKLSPENTRELTDYINGYPPAAYFAVKQAHIYSVDALMSDKRKLTQFSQKRFITHVQDHNLTTEDIKVLQILSNYSPLPLSCVISLYECDKSQAHDRIYELIDCSLIRVQDGQLYRIADPIKGAINEVFGYPANEDLKKVKNKLNEFITLAQEEHKLDISRVLFRLGYILGDKNATDSGIKLNSDYIKLLESAYHQRKYKEAIEIGLEAIANNPDSTKAKTFLIKALIQEEKWDAAQKYLDGLYPIDEYRNIYYLQGFLERKKGDLLKAIEAYSNAQKHGRKGFALYREFSHCYLMIGDLESANKYIDEALKIQPNNNQVIDMAARIAIKQGQEDAAQKYINQLELLDSPEHYKLRLSDFHLTFGHPDTALQCAREAAQLGGNRFFSGRVQLVKALIKSGELVEAEEELSKMRSDFPNSKNDIKIALQSSLELEKGRYDNALHIVDGFVNKNCKQYKGIKARCLNNLCKDVSIPYAQRRKYNEELALLGDYHDFIFDEIDS